MAATEGITKAQSRAFLAAWLGWGFDGLDGYLYTLIAVPFVSELLGKMADKSEVATRASLIQGVFLVGWALGGAVFGRIGDRIGRSRTLTLTIMMYAVFTGMAFFVHAWWQLLIVRFIAALGIGGEWAAGSALVSETLPKKYTHFASATLQNGYILGMMAAALTVGWLGAMPYRYVFLIGVVPAFATIWMRKAVPETEEWEGERKASELPKISELFRGEIRNTTIMILLLTSICLASVWALLYFSSQIIRALPEVKAMSKAQAAELIRNVTLIYCCWNLVGCYASSVLAKFVGYRWAFALLMACSFLSYYFGFKEVRSLAETRMWLNIAFFFSSGIFALFPMYIPPLFPTLIRTTGAGFSYNIGRLVAGVATFVFGMATSTALSPGLAIWYAGFLYVPGVVLALFVPVPKTE
ncbi:MAG: MFS transporter [Fimbriimonas sp.]|nr:MFS transporter [Fimbriimonas sp.]